MPREQTGHSKGPLLRTQEKTQYMEIIRWSILKSDRLYILQLNMEKLYTAKKKKKEKERKEKILGADYGSGHDLLIAKFRLKLKKVKKKH